MEQLFAQMDVYNDSAERLVKEHEWSSEHWLKWYKIYKQKDERSSLKALRIAVILSTLEVCKTGRYKLSDGSQMDLGSKSDIASSIRKNRTYLNTPKVQFAKHSATVIEVVNQDCIECALDLKAIGLNPVVLNMASNRRPGGGYMNGAAAQEENLFRRSNYNQHLEDPKQLKAYPIPEFGGIYSPNVIVFRSSEATGYDFIPPQPLSFIAVAAYRGPQTVTVGKANYQRLELTPKIADKTKQKIRTILSIAVDNGHDAIVLSALGCGAYGNPPEHMARLFKEVISKEFDRAFKHISFAIIEDANSQKKHNPEGNFIPFQKVFEHSSSKSEAKSSKEPDDSPKSKTVNTTPIKFFKAGANHGYMSTFAQYPFNVRGKQYRTVEHYFRSQQFVGTATEQSIIECKRAADIASICKNPKVKKTERAQWKNTDFQVSVMEEALRAKFEQNKDIQKLLVDTGNAPLICTWNDPYWGVGGDDRGRNQMGLSLMNVRKFFQSKSAKSEEEQVTHDPSLKRPDGIED